tara:strand:- start:1299 stop:1574 length:276 start_codon:yes stop_codon:yes gene_type:complete
MSCKGLKGDALKECKKKTPTWKNFAMANQARNNAEGVPTKRPATKIDSTQYKRGFQMGLKRLKPSAVQKKYQGETEFEKMGRWEGQNTKKK